uniref:Solute carrier organic anion transporter family member n=1 Tax=Jaculus jaculus TaxID=51337 RepID=A0A8C5KIT5_JACJA|nr:solute carrier organic anion transporter family member 1B3 [Jaculus jaculus]XP_044995464.1 solute carrier organic anion transporter family member 1B3 [Jaculus jaculus]
MDQSQNLTKNENIPSSGKQKNKCCDGFKMFLVALSLSYICKALGGIIMKSSITQIERRFDISSSMAGLIDGGFEMGNLLIIVFVSYFGSKLHRPKIIGIGCFVMGIGSILTALPHFFMGYYRYSTKSLASSLENSTLTCAANQTSLLPGASLEIGEKDCEKESKSFMWIYVLMGNMLRGIGETPIVPLGVSYIDDFAKNGQSSMYLGTLSSVAMIGPILGFTMSSLFAKIYVDVGFVDLSTIRITPKDSRWVGAWWLSFLVSGLLCIISSIPFFFLPKNPYKPKKERKASTSLQVFQTNEEKDQISNLTKHGQHASAIHMTGFLQSVKNIITNHLYVLYLVLTLLQLSNYIGSFTYVFKFVEQQYGQSAFEANFLLGVITLPTMATGMFLGGYIIKKYKFSLVGIGKYAFFTSFMSFVSQLLYFALICENKSVAGLTLTYDGINPMKPHTEVPLSYCNSDCNCDGKEWEPVCGDNGITYISPCLAGCKYLTGNKVPNNTVFYECSCVEPPASKTGNYSARLGECPRDNDCKKKHYVYIIVQVLNSFSISMGSTSLILLLVKNVRPELKSLAMGLHSLVIRTLGGILTPIYYGALIDKTCLKWSFTSCGKRGACRIYSSELFGKTYLTLNTSLKFSSLVLYIVFIYAMKRKYEGKNAKALEDGGKTTEANLDSVNNNGRCVSPAGVDSETHM